MCIEFIPIFILSLEVKRKRVTLDFGLCKVIILNLIQPKYKINAYRVVLRLNANVY